jgi:hypothetical protein
MDGKMDGDLVFPLLNGSSKVLIRLDRCLINEA